MCLNTVVENQVHRCAFVQCSVADCSPSLVHFGHRNARTGQLKKEKMRWFCFLIFSCPICVHDSLDSSFGILVMEPDVVLMLIHLKALCLEHCWAAILLSMVKSDHITIAFLAVQTTLAIWELPLPQCLMFFTQSCARFRVSCLWYHYPCQAQSQISHVYFVLMLELNPKLMTGRLDDCMYLQVY